jgi:hypothetical protein
MDQSVSAVESEFCQHLRALDGRESRQNEAVNIRSNVEYSIGANLRGERGS